MSSASQSSNGLPSVLNDVLIQAQSLIAQTTTSLSAPLGLDESTTSTALVIALSSAFFFLVMTWTSRFGNLGRFSPFAREPPKGNNTVSDADFSYITADDLQKHASENASQSSYDASAVRDTDILILRNSGKSYAIHFPAHSIGKSEVTIGQVREHAARKLNSSQQRVKLVHKGRTLTADGQPCRQAGLAHNSELLCIVAEGLGSESDDEDDDDTGVEDSAGGGGEGEQGGKKRRNRGKKSKRRNKRETTQDPSASGRGTPPVVAPTTPLGKLEALREKLNSYLPDVNAFEASPPADPAKREFEFKKLSETILAQVLLKTDAIETDGDPDLRAKRKELVRDTQAVLTRLDAIGKP